MVGPAVGGWLAEGRSSFRELLRPLRALLITEREVLAEPSNVRSFHGFHGSDSFLK